MTQSLTSLNVIPEELKKQYDIKIRTLLLLNNSAYRLGVDLCSVAMNNTFYQEDLIPINYGKSGDSLEPVPYPISMEPITNSESLHQLNGMEELCPFKAGTSPIGTPTSTRPARKKGRLSTTKKSSMDCKATGSKPGLLWRVLQMFGDLVPSHRPRSE